MPLHPDEVNHISDEILRARVDEIINDLTLEGAPMTVRPRVVPYMTYFLLNRIWKLIKLRAPDKMIQVSST